MEEEQIRTLVEGLRLIEEGVAKIQGLMKEVHAKSIREVAEQLIPIFKADDDSLSDSIIKYMS